MKTRRIDKGKGWKFSEGCMRAWDAIWSQVIWPKQFLSSKANNLIKLWRIFLVRRLSDSVRRTLEFGSVSVSLSVCFFPVKPRDRIFWFFACNLVLGNVRTWHFCFFPKNSFSPLLDPRGVKNRGYWLKLPFFEGFLSITLGFVIGFGWKLPKVFF